MVIASKGAKPTISTPALSLTGELLLNLPRELAASSSSMVFPGSSNLLPELHHACHHDTPLAARKCGGTSQSVQHAAVGQPAGVSQLLTNSVLQGSSRHPVQGSSRLSELPTQISCVCYVCHVCCVTSSNDALLAARECDNIKHNISQAFQPEVIYIGQPTGRCTQAGKCIQKDVNSPHGQAIGHG